MESKVSKHTRKGAHTSTVHKRPLRSMTLLQGHGTSQLLAERNGPNQATKGSSQHRTSPPSANIAMSMSKPRRYVCILGTSCHLRYTATHFYIWDSSADHAVEDLKNDQIEDLTRRDIPVAIQRRSRARLQKLSCMN